MARYESVLQLIGGTPLLHLRRLEEAEGLGGRVYAKLERNSSTDSAFLRFASNPAFFPPCWEGGNIRLFAG